MDTKYAKYRKILLELELTELAPAEKLVVAMLEMSLPRPRIGENRRRVEKKG